MPSKPQLSIVCVFDPVDGSKNPAKGREDNAVWSLQCVMLFPLGWIQVMSIGGTHPRFRFSKLTSVNEYFFSKLGVVVYDYF